jgi:uncharacterized membrane protein
MTELLRQVFGLVCGQAPAHTWFPDGAPLPFCQRCTGLYVGAFMAGLIHLALRPQPSRARLWTYGALLLQMIPLGYHWVPQTALVRTLSGLAFAFGLVGCFTLLTKPSQPPRLATELALALAGGVVVLWLAGNGGVPGAVALSVAGAAGLLVLAGLVVANIVLLFWRRRL